MSLGTARLSATLQTLIDARLDTIDRMLLGRVARQDRLAIVREVESQLFELLHERGEDDFTREDVLAVLARLDPPEAYLPDDEEENVSPRAVAPPREMRPARRNVSLKQARASGILGLSALAMVLLSPLIFFIGEALADAVSVGGVIFFWSIAIMATFAASIVAIVLGILGRRGGAWAVAGLVTGILSVLFAFAAGIHLVLEL